jgi:hypothetical protein
MLQPFRWPLEDYLHLTRRAVEAQPVAAPLLVDQVERFLERRLTLVAAAQAELVLEAIASAHDPRAAHVHACLGGRRDAQHAGRR